MEDYIRITQLNDFIFCPLSIYFHNLYGNQNEKLYQRKVQVEGKNAHEIIDSGQYSSRKNTVSGMDVYSEKYSLIGKIDILDGSTLIERKKKVKVIYDGYVFQLYAQYMALLEMGYEVNKLEIRSMDDNKVYPIPLPNEDKEMLAKFENVIANIKEFKIDEYVQSNVKKCQNCIYEPACDRSLL